MSQKSENSPAQCLAEKLKRFDAIFDPAHPIEESETFFRNLAEKMIARGDWSIR